MSKILLKKKIYLDKFLNQFDFEIIKGTEYDILIGPKEKNGEQPKSIIVCDVKMRYGYVYAIEDAIKRMVELNPKPYWANRVNEIISELRP